MILVAALIIVLIYVMARIDGLFGNVQKIGRRATLHNLKVREMRLKQERMIEERAARSLIAEAKAAEANNRALIQDLNIELLKLKIAKAEKELGLNVPPFDPNDHGG